MPNPTLTILRSHLLRSLSYSCYLLQPGLNLVAALVEFEAHVFLRSLITICSKIDFEPSISKKIQRQT
jgi:hypothetical protein